MHPLPSGPVVVFQFDNRCLREAKLVEIDVETPIVFDGVRGHKGYEVAKIFATNGGGGGSTTSRQTSRCHGLGSKGMGRGVPSKGVNVSVRSVAKVFVRRNYCGAPGSNALSERIATSFQPRQLHFLFCGS
jgi:hypothetical protein